MEMPTMTTTGVGESHPKNYLGSQGAHFNMPPNLTLVMPNPTPQEITDVKYSPVQMGLTVIDGIIFIPYRLGNKLNGEAPFQVRLYDPFGLKIDTSIEIPKSMGLILQIDLVDSNTNIVKVIRMIGPSTEFSRALMVAIQNQYDSDFDPDTYQDKLNHIYDYNSSYDIFRKSLHKFTIQAKS